jgi:hypothetical protein
MVPDSMLPDSAFALSMDTGYDIALLQCRFFQDVQVWPYDKLDPGPWLENFLQNERPYALQMLRSFMYFPDPMIDQMLKAAVGTLSVRKTVGHPTFAQAKAAWNAFLRGSLFSWFPGETITNADSGFIFARKARDVLGADVSQLLSPEEVLRSLARHGPRPVIFIDDFIGSGDQCVTGWHRVYPGGLGSFSSIAAASPHEFYYCPLISTEVGNRRVQSECKGLSISPAHILPRTYSLLVPDSIFWPESLRPHARDVLRGVSERAGFADTDGADGDDWQGFHQQGLALSFYHGTPDATLPIFRAQRDGWVPLIRRPQ